MKTFCLSSLLLIFVIGTSKADTFTFVPDGRPLTIYVDEEPPSVVQCALTMFCDDYKCVFGDSPQRANRDKADIIVECSENGEWEHFDISVSRQGRLHVKGSDPRGTAYGILELSRLIGISPWVWWADVPPQKLSSYTLPAGYHNSQQPSVQYRGIFINDEDYGLNPWSWKTHEPESDKGEIGPRTYERIFQLLLRLRANMLMPAMHDCSVPFYMVEGNKEMAEKYQIVMATSHCEPLMRNNVGEWDDSRRGRYNYISNRDSVLAYWRERLEEVGKSENIYTIGMRGKHDGKMEGCKNTAEMAQIMPRVIEDQRSLLSLYVDSPANQVPQIFVPYKELLDVYNKGMELLIGGTPVQTKDWTWETSINLSGNRGTVENLTQGMDILYVTDAQVGTAKAASFNNGKFMGISGSKWQRDPNGNVILNNSYMPVVDSNTALYVGDREPNVQGGWNNTLSWERGSFGRLTFNMLWEFRFGGMVYNGTEYFMTNAGLSEISENRESITIKGVQQTGTDAKGNPIYTPAEKTFNADGTYNLNGAQVSGRYLIQSYYQNYYCQETANFLTEVNSLRLRTISLTWDLPSKWLEKSKVFKRASISVTGNNLLLFTNYNGDPELAVAGSGAVGSSSVGIDYCGVPSTASVAFGVNLTF